MYKARDTRLNRTVAIKALPEHIAKREGLRARFERAARSSFAESPRHHEILAPIGVGGIGEVPKARLGSSDGRGVLGCAVTRAWSSSAVYPGNLDITMATAKPTKRPKRELSPQVLASDKGAKNEWWTTFFDNEYLRIWGQMFTEDANGKQAADLWSMLDLEPGCRLLDAPCGWGRLSRPLALLGADVLGVDQSETLVATAIDQRGDLPSGRLRYLRHDLRLPLKETGFDVACNIFTSFGYGTEEEDVAIFRTLRDAVRLGGRVVVETNHRDLVCSFIARGSTASKRLPDGTLFVDQPEFDALSGVVHLNWYWSGALGSGEKHAEWRCYTPTQIVGLLERAGLRFAGAYRGLTKNRYQAEGPEVGGRLAVVAVRDN